MQNKFIYALRLLLHITTVMTFYFIIVHPHKVLGIGLGALFLIAELYINKKYKDMMNYSKIMTFYTFFYSFLMVDLSHEVKLNSISMNTYITVYLLFLWVFARIMYHDFTKIKKGAIK